MTRHETVSYDAAQKDHLVTQRDHEYDGAGRLVNSGYRQYWQSEEPPAFEGVEHCYAGKRFLQNYDGTSSHGKPWHWAGTGAQNTHNTPVKSPQPDTANSSDYNAANDTSPQRAMLSPNTAVIQAQRNLGGQGNVMAVGSSGSGANWVMYPTRGSELPLRGVPRELPTRPCTHWRGAGIR